MRFLVAVAGIFTMLVLLAPRRYELVCSSIISDVRAALRRLRHKQQQDLSGA